LRPDGATAPALAEYLRVAAFKISQSLQATLDAPAVSPQLMSEFAAGGATLSGTETVSAEVPGGRWRIRTTASQYEIHDVGNELQVFRTVDPAVPIFPMFKAMLPPDLVFFGFPFTADAARVGADGLGKYFIIEERIGEPRFGLDLPTTDAPATWNDLSWSHFGLDGEGAAGQYLDGAPRADPDRPATTEGREWSGNITSSATRAWITLQRPVRVAVHASKMLPPP
jgi:hypothetical protein